MRTVKLTDLINMSWERTTEVLFKPFRLKMWLRWVLIAVLAGGMSSSGNLFRYMPSGSSKSSEKSSVATPKSAIPAVSEEFKQPQAPTVTAHLPASKSSASVLSIKKSKDRSPFAHANLMLLGSIVVLVFVAFIALFLFLSWLGCRFQFIFTHVLMHGDTLIRNVFGIYRTQGNGLFKFYMLNMLAFFAGGLMLAVSIGVFAAFKTGLNNVVLIAFAVIAGIALVAFSIFWLAIVLGVYVHHFVVTIMTVDQCTFDEGWKKFWAIYRQMPGEFGKYLLMLIAIGIVLACAVGIAVILLILALVLAGFIIFGGLYLIFGLLLKSTMLFAISAIVFGIPFAALSIILVLMVCLPSAVFVRYFSLYFLSSLNVGYAPVPLTAIEPIQPSQS